MSSDNNLQHNDNKMKNRMFVVPDNDLSTRTAIEILKAEHEKVLITDQIFEANWGDIELDVSMSIAKHVSQGGKVYGVGLEGPLPKELIGKNDDPRSICNVKNNRLCSKVRLVSFLIGHELNRWEHLVAANDRWLDAGMIRIDASKEEIESIHMAEKEIYEALYKREEKAVKTIENAIREGWYFGNDGKDIIIQLSDPDCAKERDMQILIKNLLTLHYDNLLITTEHGETRFFGERNIIDKLQEQYKDSVTADCFDLIHTGWCGYPPKDEVVELISSLYNEQKRDGMPQYAEELFIELYGEQERDNMPQNIETGELDLKDIDVVYAEKMFNDMSENTESQGRDNLDFEYD